MLIYFSLDPRIVADFQNCDTFYAQPDIYIRATLKFNKTCDILLKH